MKKPRVLILRTAGTNCDKETAFAFSYVGAAVELVHINQLKRREKELDNFQILVFPGGFTYGDDIAAGKILANELKFKLRPSLLKFIKKGKIILGICNGFQILVKAGLLPKGNAFRQTFTLSINDSGKFEDRWVYLKKSKAHDSKCIWTKDIPSIIYLPVAHAEGKFIPKDKASLNRLKKNRQIVFQYSDPEGNLATYPYNPNGSVDSIAGICDTTGRIFGLMPHPERHIHFTQHPRWMRNQGKKYGDGVMIFKNGTDYIRKRF